MKRIPHLLFSVIATLFILNPLITSAQTVSDTPSDTLWTTGKIFVVLIVAFIIFSGIGIFLVALERKISRLEKKIYEKKL